MFIFATFHQIIKGMMAEFIKLPQFQSPSTVHAFTKEVS